MPAQKWLNWSPSGSEIVQLAQAGPGNTAADIVLSVLSVQREPEPKDSAGSLRKGVHAICETHGNNLYDLDAAEALQEIAGLLAAAYQRFARVTRVPANPAGNLAQDGLALSGG
jgi:hypothetical protein